MSQFKLVGNKAPLRRTIVFSMENVPPEMSIDDYLGIDTSRADVEYMWDVPGSIGTQVRVILPY